MFRIASTTALIGIVLLLSSGCERKSPTGETKDATPQAAAAKHSPDDGHNHAGGMKSDEHAGHDHGEADHDDHAGHDHGEAGHDDHAGHDHGEADHDDHAGHDHGSGHGHGGQRHELGSRETAGITVEVVQFGAATGNVAELVFELEVRGEPMPTAVRLLVRAPDGAESLKVKANKTGDHEYDAHVGELPKQLGEGSVLVVEVETPSGTEKLMFTLKT